MTKLHKELIARMDKAVLEYNMFSANDEVVVAVSGGADSMALLDLLALRLQYYADNITLKAVYVDMGFGWHVQERCNIVQDYFNRLGVTGETIHTDIGPFSHSDANKENPCFLCARLRRKRIFEATKEMGCNKLVFGHHKDDLVETLLLNMIYNREISTMPPMLEFFKGLFHVVRPLLYIEEELLKKFIKERDIPTFSQDCPTDGHSKRQYAKELLNTLDDDIQGARENIFASMKRVKSKYLL